VPDADAGSSSGEVFPTSPPWHPHTKLVMGVVLGVGALVALYFARGVIHLVALSGLIAFLLAPPIRWTHRRLHLPRWLALLLTYLVALVAVLAVGTLIAAAAVQSVRQMDPAAMLHTIQDWLARITTEFRFVSIVGVTVDLSGVMDPLHRFLVGGAVTAGEGGTTIGLGPGTVAGLVSDIVGGVYFVVGLLTALFMSALITILVSMYLNADSERFSKALLENVPPGYEEDAIRLARRVKEIWTGFLYGQLINSVITGALVFFVLWAVGLPGAFLMGLIMGILNMIPTFGPILAAVPGILAAVVSGSTRFDMSNLAFGLLVTIIYVVVVQLQANLVAPRVMGSAVQLRPVTVIVGLMVGFAVMGLLGSLLAVPVVATLKTFWLYGYDKLIDRDPFRRAALNGTAR